MNARTAQILQAAIQSFIASGEPVSSGWLFDHYDFGIKPAMIRLELDELEDGGYLAKPHHSAGRVPTDHGYEFFANEILSKVSESSESAFGELLREKEWAAFLGRLSDELGLLGVAAGPARGEVHKVGLEALVDCLDWEDRDAIRSVIRDFEELDERIPSAAEKLGEGPRVFIGKKSPVTKSEGLSVIAGNYKVGNASVSIFAIGPKRMDYKNAIRIFKSL